VILGAVWEPPLLPIALVNGLRKRKRIDVSYIVLARKWRPKRFEDVVGQEHITTTLLNSIQAGRTAHAYLFVGPRGVGKTSTARIFSTALNCPQTNNGEPCGECEVCRDISAGRSIDVIEIDGASNNGVDDIRTLRENVKIAPANLKLKVYIIDEVHMLSAGAFNAFLKTLEEPPAHVKFLMATTEAHKIPPTVLSRCQRFDFRRLTSRQIFQRLKVIVDAEAIKIEESALFALARSAEGSMRDAQSMLDQLVSFSDSEITLSDVQTMLGTVGQEVYNKVAVAISEGDAFAILKTIDEVVERGKDLALFLRELTAYFRNLLVAGLGGGVELLDVPEEDLPSVKEISDRFKQSALIRIVHDLSDLESRFRQVPSTRVALEMLLMKMARVGADISIDSLLSKLTDLEKNIRAGNTKSVSAGIIEDQMSLYPQERGDAVYSQEDNPSTPEETVEEPDEANETPEAPSEDEGEPQLNLWRQFLNEIREQRMSIYSFLNKGRFCGIKNGEAILCFDEESQYNKTHLERKEVKMLLEETLKSLAGTAVRLKIIIEANDSDTSPKLQEKVARTSHPDSQAAKKKQKVEQVLENPIVKKTVELFKGKIIYVNG
jgi:DNA polymerase-3 subunit gamma/tau